MGCLNRSHPSYGKFLVVCTDCLLYMFSCSFNLLSYCHSPRRLAVGSRSGRVALYELKGPKSQMISAHACPITAVSFSPDGRLLSTYSAGDSKITVWQVLLAI